MKNDSEFKKVICDGKEFPDYYVNREGVFFSTKSGFPKTLKINFTENKHNPYPKIGLRINGKPTTKLVHRLVCETWKLPPIPEELESVDWESIPEKDRDIILQFVTRAERYQVNHLDHDINNFRAENLEWVSAKQNQDRYQEFRSMG